MDAFLCAMVKTMNGGVAPVTEQRFQLPRHSTADVGKELMKYVREQSGINVK
jgi:hypothetical protein